MPPPESPVVKTVEPISGGLPSYPSCPLWQIKASEQYLLEHATAIPGIVEGNDTEQSWEVPSWNEDEGDKRGTIVGCVRTTRLGHAAELEHMSRHFIWDRLNGHNPSVDRARAASL